MLVLTRQVNQILCLGNNVQIKVLRVEETQATLGFSVQVVSGRLVEKTERLVERDDPYDIEADMSVQIVDIRGGKVRIALSSPSKTQVHPKEIYDDVRRKKGQEPIADWWDS